MSRFRPPSLQEIKSMKESFRPQAIEKVTEGKKTDWKELTLLEKFKVNLECEMMVKMINW